MVDTKDLMQGNLVYDSKLDRVIRIHNVLCGMDMSHREGIPITEEALLTIGFKEYDDLGEYTYYRYWEEEYKYKLDIRKHWCNSPKDWHIHIDNGDCCTIGCGEVDYIHELQNLVRVCTGYELPIYKDIWEKESTEQA